MGSEVIVFSENHSTLWERAKDPSPSLTLEEMEEERPPKLWWAEARTMPPTLKGPRRSSPLLEERPVYSFCRKSGGECPPLRVLPSFAFERMWESPSALPVERAQESIPPCSLGGLEKVPSHCSTSRRILLTPCVQHAKESPPHFCCQGNGGTS